MSKVADAITAIPPGGRDWKQWRKEREEEKSQEEVSML